MLILYSQFIDGKTGTESFSNLSKVMKLGNGSAEN